MTIHVTIGEAGAQLAELVAAALRGEEVVLGRAGEAQVRLTPVAERGADDRAATVASRLAAIGMWRDRMPADDAALRPSMTDDELEERWHRKFGPAA